MRNSETLSFPTTSCGGTKAIIAALAIATLVLLKPAASAQDQSPDQNRPKGLVSTPASRPFGLNPGDVIEVQVFDTPEISGKYQLTQQGEIRLPGTGTISIDDLTTSEAATLLEKRLKEAGVMDSPQVSVFLVTAAPVEVNVAGEVARPGTYVLTGLPTLQSALSAAGGPTERQGAIVTITHHNDPQHPETIRVSAEYPSGDDPFRKLSAWDLVTVSRAGIVYAVGDIGHPGQYYLNNGRPLRALELLAIAGGAKDYAALDKATILSPTQDGVKARRINLARIQKNLDPDPSLEPDDVLVVPHSGMKQFALTSLPGLTTTVLNAIAIALVAR